MNKQNLSDLYKEVELTEDERNEAIEEALFNARYKKSAAMKMEAYRREISQPKQFKRYSAKELFNHLKNLDGFTIDEANEYIISQMCLYFADDPEFEQHGLSLNKGILLFGKIGVGKTFLMTLFRLNQKQSYQVVACQDVEGTYARIGDEGSEKTGESGLKRYYVNMPITQNQYGQEHSGYLFDDLGQENQNTKFFGTERNVMMEVLSQRYKNRLFTSTHITTNLNATQIKDKYGDRVADRMREMFNTLAFGSKAVSRRK